MQEREGEGKGKDEDKVLHPSFIFVPCIDLL